jgi:zinc protease
MNRFALLVLLTLAMPARAQMDPGDSVPLDPAFLTGTLENGLTWYVRNNDEPHSRAFLHLLVHAGSLQEEDDQRGLAHFLEHMAFNGTENFRKQQLIDYLESIGMEFGPEVNAYTSFDETVYMLTVPTDDDEYIEQAFDILADWSRNILIEEEEVELERGVVLDEWRRRLGARQRIRDQESKLTYYGSRYAERLPIGDPEIIDSATSDPLRRFYEAWYRPDLMAVVAVGDFDEERIQRLIREHFSGNWGPDDAPQAFSPEIVPHDQTLFGLYEDEEFTRSTARILLKDEDPPVRTVGDYRDGLVGWLVQSMFSARLRELIDRNEATYTSSRFRRGRSSPSWVTTTISASSAEGELLPALEQVLSEWQRVRDHGFLASELEREKREILRVGEARWKDRANQESSSLARRMAGVFTGESVLPGPEWEYDAYRELLPTITLDDLSGYVAGIDFTRESSRVVFSNTPQREGLAPPTEEELLAVVERASNSDLPPWVDAGAGATLVDALPTAGEVVASSYDADLDLTTWTLSNGVRVLVKPTDFNDDRFSMEAFSPGGRSLGDPGLNPSQDLAASAVLVGGAGDLDAAALRKALAGKLADASPWIRSYEEGFSGGGSTDDLETALQMLWLRATRPRSDQSAFDSLVERIAASIENRSLDPNRVYGDSVQVILYGHDPRVRPPQMADIERMDLDESIAFYRDRFADLDDLTVVMVGDLDLDDLRPLVERWLGSLPATEREETWKDRHLDWVAGPLERVIEVGVDDKARTSMFLHGDAEWTRLDRYSISALASALQIRLREILREDLSGTYGVSVSADLERRPTPRWSLSIRFGCEPARLQELVAETLVVLEETRQRGLPAEYLQKVREQDLRSNEENVRRNGYWVSVIGFRERYGIDQREELETREFLRAFSQEDLDAAARRYLPLERLIRIDQIPATP